MAESSFAQQNSESSKPSGSQSSLDDWMQQAEDFARREPTKAVVAAFGAGFLLNFLPLAGIVSALIGITLGLVRPALLFLGVLKACDYCRINPLTRHE